MTRNDENFLRRAIVNLIDEHGELATLDFIASVFTDEGYEELGKRLDDLGLELLHGGDD